MGKVSTVEINGHNYRYEYDEGTQKTLYRGPVGDAPAISEEEFMALVTLEDGTLVDVTLVESASGIPFGPEQEDIEREQKIRQAKKTEDAKEQQDLEQQERHELQEMWERDEKARAKQDAEEAQRVYDQD